MKLTPHVHRVPCRPCREGRHDACVLVRTYGDNQNCRYVCDCAHRTNRETP